MVDNGGTSCSIAPHGVAKNGNFMKFGRVYSQTKPVSMEREKRYYADGTGRDNYVTAGWERDGTMAERERRFRSTFREESRERIWGGHKEWRKSWGSFKEVNPENQMMVTRRLSIPKRKENKYRIRLEEIRGMNEGKGN